MKASLHFAPILLLNTFLFFAGWLSISSHSDPISGTVQNTTGTVLQNVEIMNLSTNFVVMSDEKGHFEINASPGDKLLFRSSGYPAFEMIVGASTNLTVTLGQARNMTTSTFTNGTREKHPAIRTIHGRVSDISGPLPGANVVVRGTHYGVQTDIDGHYAIEAIKGEQLVFSFVGLGDETVTVGLSDEINVKLSDSGVRLEEVVVEGYKGAEKKSIAYSTVKIRGLASTSETAPKPAAIDKVGGKVAGLSIAGDDLPKMKAGQLTAGEVNDFSKWTYWDDVAMTELSEYQNRWKMAPTLRFSVILTYADGFAVHNQKLHLMTRTGDTIWTSRTGNTGRAELWFKPDQTDPKITEPLVIVDDKGTVVAAYPKEFRNGINTFTYAGHCSAPEKVDIAFMVDATGSMGDEIRYLQSELSDVIERTKKAMPNTDLRIGSVFYRDTGDEYLVKNFDFTHKISDVLTFIGKQSAGGGGDYPEAVVEAFEGAIEQLHWADDARAKLLFVLLDAPAHENEKNIKKLQMLSKLASAKGIKIIPVAASGINKSTEYLMRSMALQTNGTYLFITNHSGIGNDHIAPTTDSYAVEMLNDLLLRVIIQFTAAGDCTSQSLPTNAKMDAALDKKQKIQWKYYPNPTSGNVTVECGKRASGLSLFDTTGKLVLRQITPADHYVIDLTGLPNAVYYLNVSVGEEILFGKIIKRM